MYQQYRLINNEYIHISSSGRPDEDNEKILNGDFLDKTPLITEQGEIPFTMPSRDELLKQIFSDWQVGDILYIGSGELENPIWDNGNLREKSREEVCATGDLSVLYDGEIWEDGIITYIEPPKEFLKPKWVYPNWVDDASDFDRVSNAYTKYMTLNNPRDIRKMTIEGIDVDYWNYIDSLEVYINNYKLGIMTVQTIPVPSLSLENFLENNFRL